MREMRWVRGDIRGLHLHVIELKQTDRPCISRFVFLNMINSSHLGSRSISTHIHMFKKLELDDVLP
jgi:hypothetical protein